MAPNLASIVPSVVEVVGNILSLLPLVNRAPVPAIVALLVVEVRDDSPSPSLILEVESDSSSPPSVVEVRDDSFSLSPETFTSPSIDVHHQDNGEGVFVDEKERVTSKRGREKEDAGVDSGEVRKSRMTLF
ncbi:hypothetical protein Adt_35417 [Abeliophyllum distichum]|uniref:Uncharacterized protein n=1 Tax=Abeliophyllum distichum TaxID=126358 RepID=A0ABD1QEN5_9LAMI